MFYLNYFHVSVQYRLIVLNWNLSAITLVLSFTCLQSTYFHDNNLGLRLQSFGI
jgi:hypothetical protein